MLGGRLADIEYFLRRIKAGETPRAAITAIVEQSASEVLKMLDFSDDAREWTPEQAWSVVRALHRHGSVPYYAVLEMDAFGDCAGSRAARAAALRALEQAELIAVRSGPNGRPATVGPGKPVYGFAFARLCADEPLASRYDVLLDQLFLRNADAVLQRCRDELYQLSRLPRSPAVRDRMASLDRQLGRVHDQSRRCRDRANAYHASLER